MDGRVKHYFTVDNNEAHLPADKDLTFLGELRWVVDAQGKYFEHHILSEAPHLKN